MASSKWDYSVREGCPNGLLESTSALYNRMPRLKPNPIKEIKQMPFVNIPQRT